MFKIVMAVIAFLGIAIWGMCVGQYLDARKDVKRGRLVMYSSDLAWRAAYIALGGVIQVAFYVYVLLRFAGVIW